MSLRYLSVCSGIEAATVAWHPLGWMPAAFSEIEAAPRAVLSHRWPEVPLHGDFTTIRGDEYGAIDLLVGGTPCQSFSVAGLRGGLADGRGNLALEYLRLADRLRPRWLVWENVPGVLSSNGGRDFGSILGGMVELGYGFAYRVLDAQYVRVDGLERAVPQRRRRVFVVGHLGDWRRAAAVLLERASLRGDPAPSRGEGAGAAIGTLGGTSPGGGWRLGSDEAAAGQLVVGALSCGDRGISPDQAAAGHIVAAFDQTNGLIGDVFGTLEAAQAKDNRGRDVIAFDTTQITSAENRARPEPGGPCHPLSAGAHAPAIALDLRNALRTTEQADPSARQGMGIGDDCAFTLSSAVEPGVMANCIVRRLTPTECERLQGFPDGHTTIPWRGGTMPDGPRYKMLGNSMAVNVMRWIGRRIDAVELIGRVEVAA